MIEYIKNAMAHKNEEGFSLIELIIVVAILGILVAVAIPVYGNIQTTARHNALDTAAANAATSVAAQLAQGSDAATAFAALDVTKYSYVDGTEEVGALGNADIDITAVTLPAEVNTGTDNVFVAASDGASTDGTLDVAWAGTAAGAGHSWA